MCDSCNDIQDILLRCNIIFVYILYISQKQTHIYTHTHIFLRIQKLDGDVQIRLESLLMEGRTDAQRGPKWKGFYTLCTFEL